MKVFKYIRNNKPFDKYVADTLELDQRLTMNNKFKYLITYVDHFSNYTWCFHFNNKAGYSIVRKLFLIFIQGNPKDL